VKAGVQRKRTRCSRGVDEKVGRYINNLIYFPEGEAVDRVAANNNALNNPSYAERSIATSGVASLEMIVLREIRATSSVIGHFGVRLKIRDFHPQL
jgi:hypothetical protein